MVRQHVVVERVHSVACHVIPYQPVIPRELAV